MNTQVTVVVVDDHPVVLAGLTALLRKHEEISVVGTANTAQGAVSAVLQHRPNVVLLDLILADGESEDGIRLARRLGGLEPAPAVVVLTAHGDDELAFRAFQAGVDAFLLKTVAEDSLIDTLLKVHRGERFVSEVILGKDIVDQFKELGKLRAQFQIGVSAEMVEVLEALAQGATNSDLSASFNWSEPTTKRRLRSLFATLGVSSRVEAVLAASRLGII